MEVLS
jgi:hypothetical protein